MDLSKNKLTKKDLNTLFLKHSQILKQIFKINQGLQKYGSDRENNISCALRVPKEFIYLS